MKSFLTFSLFVVLSSAFCLQSLAAEDIYLRDVPEGHWAYDSVYDLIQQGVTGGYPDGTYRGKKLMTRYELAAFLSKLGQSFNKQQGINEKLLAELNAEAAEELAAREKEQRENQVTSLLEGRWRAAQGDYRLRVNYLKTFGTNSSLKINLDTMDSGYSGGTRDLAREMLDLEGKVKAGWLRLKMTDGPGDVTRAYAALFPMDNRRQYRRPRRTASITADFGRTVMALEYLARSTAASGLVTTSEISGKMTFNFRPVTLTINPRYFSNLYDQRDMRLDLVGEWRPNDNFLLGWLAGLAKASNYPHGLYLKGNLKVRDVFEVVAQKVGSQYREKFTYGIFDLFDRNLPDGSTSLGANLQGSNQDWYGQLLGDWTDPGSVITAELHLGRKFGPATKLGLLYQYCKGATSGQAGGLEASFNF